MNTSIYCCTNFSSLNSESILLTQNIPLQNNYAHTQNEFYFKTTVIVVILAEFPLFVSWIESA